MMGTCDWCGAESNSIQSKAGGAMSASLCPTCCPDVDVNEIPDDAPSSWWFMSEEEKESWKDGMSIEEIMEEFAWAKPPDWRPKQ